MEMKERVCSILNKMEMAEKSLTNSPSRHKVILEKSTQSDTPRSIPKTPIKAPVPKPGTSQNSNTTKPHDSYSALTDTITRLATQVEVVLIQNAKTNSRIQLIENLITTK